MPAKRVKYVYPDIGDSISATVFYSQTLDRWFWRLDKEKRTKRDRIACGASSFVITCHCSYKSPSKAKNGVWRFLSKHWRQFELYFDGWERIDASDE